MKRKFYIAAVTKNISGIGAIVLQELSHVVYAVNKGYIPIIDLKHYKNQYFKENREYSDNVWEYFFKQPMGFSLGDIQSKDEVVISDNISCPDGYPFYYPNEISFDIKQQELKNEYKKYLKFNDDVINFINLNYKDKLENAEDTLAVLLRGTDYTKRKTLGEFIQPDIKKVIKDARKLLSENKFKRIYLATEDVEIYNKFKAEFKDKLIPNNQYMYSDNYDKTKYLSEIKVNRENHNYYLAVEYLASLYFLSKCGGYLGGMTSGTRISYILSDTWKYVKIYNLGRYGLYSSKFEKIFSIKEWTTGASRYIMLTFFFMKLRLNLNKISIHKVIPNKKEAVKYKHNYDKTKVKGVIYTCSTGGYDSVPKVLCANPEWDYIMFTDNKKLLNKKEIGVWKIKPLQFDKLDNTKNARWHKTHPHKLFPDYDKSIWIDSNIQILNDKIYKMADFTREPMFVPLHYERDCVFDECSACLLEKKEGAENIEKVKQFLVTSGMPKHYGLNETNIIFRHHKDEKVIKIMEDWWDLIFNLSKRDQLTFSFVLWKNNVKVHDIAIKNAGLDINNFCMMRHKK